MTYQRGDVEHLLPLVWDRDAAWGIQDPRQPDHDMPRRKVAKKRESSHLAHLVDIRRAWEGAPLSRKQRRAVLLRYGFDLTLNGCAAQEGISKQAMAERAESAIGAMTAWLNGDLASASLDGTFILDQTEGDS